MTFSTERKIGRYIEVTVFYDVTFYDGSLYDKTGLCVHESFRDINDTSYISTDSHTVIFRHSIK